MGFVAFLGHFLVGTAPLLVVYAFFVARKSFLVLLTLASSFYWLIVLLFISALFKGFTPIANTAGDHVGAIIAAVLIEQIARTLLYRVHKITIATLADVAQKTGHSLSPCDTLYVSLGFGFGHGASHSVFFFISMLPLLTSHATLYVETCTKMSYFLVSALTTLGFGMLHTFSTIVFFDGLAERKALKWSVPPVLHLVAALITIGNFGSDGCMYTTPAVLFVGVVSAVWCGFICVEKGARRSGTILQNA